MGDRDHCQFVFSLKSLISSQSFLFGDSFIPFPFRKREAEPDRIFIFLNKAFSLSSHVNEDITSSSQVITEYGKQNIFARETPPQLVENYTSYPKEAEKTNGRWAMIGMISLLGAYVTTGQIIPGIF